MKFEETDNLNPEDVTALYNDIVEFGDDRYLLAGSGYDECCPGWRRGSEYNCVCTYYRYMTDSECVYWSINWCKGVGKGFTSARIAHYNYGHFYECI